MLHFFNLRAGLPPSGKCFGWDGWIEGSATGNFMMGIGSLLQTGTQDSVLRANLEMVVAGIRAAQASNGWLWAFNESNLWTDNLPDYCAG